MGIPHTREPWWKFLLARAFGKKMTSVDTDLKDGTVVMAIGYHWRGRLYIIKYEVGVDPARSEP